MEYGLNGAYGAIAANPVAMELRLGIELAYLPYMVVVIVLDSLKKLPCVTPIIVLVSIQYTYITDSYDHCLFFNT